MSEATKYRVELEGSPVRAALPKRAFSAREILKVTAEYFQVSGAEIIGRGRSKSITHCRHIAMHLCRYVADMSYPEIGKVFGFRDHTSVMSAVRKIDRMVERQDPALEQIRAIRTQLEER